MTLLYDGMPFERAASTGYLGVLFTSNGLPSKHISKRLTKSSALLGTLSAFGSSAWGLTAKDRKLFYDSVVLPTLCYGVDLWPELTATSFRTLHTCQNKAAKWISGLPRDTLIADLLHHCRLPRVARVLEATRLREDLGSLLLPRPCCTARVRSAAESHFRDFSNHRVVPFQLPVSPYSFGHPNLSSSIHLSPRFSDFWLRLAQNPRQYATGLHNFFAGYHVLYTDGSASDDSAVAAFYDPGLHTWGGRNLPGGTSSADAESVALVMAPEWVIRLSPVVILSDSKAALERVACHPSHSDSIMLDGMPAYYNWLVSRLELTVLFDWIPAHRGIPGNEVADTLAKRAAGCRQMTVTDLSSTRSLKSETTGCLRA